MLQHLPLLLKLLIAAGILIAAYTFLFYSEEVYKFAGQLINFIFKTIFFLIFIGFISILCWAIFVFIIKFIRSNLTLWCSKRCLNPTSRPSSTSDTNNRFFYIFKIILWVFTKILRVAIVAKNRFWYEQKLPTTYSTF